MEELQWVINVNIFLRGRFRSYLLAQSFYRAGGISLEFRESKKILSSDFFIKAHGSNRDELALWRKAVLERLNEVL